ncbi:MAG TPA: alpha-2-macroglobulin family protein, partial [Acidobacteriota bacterium]|nr:alpha-2-macroglobulin family protein [Acidobacteriota bacterium]
EALPVSRWEDYLIPNNYPPGIRPSLRAAVSYLYAEMLADTNGWRPDQLNGIFRLDLRLLLSDAPDASALADTGRHPLEKICAVLADLETWHLGTGNREAALEARLERYRHLHQHFSLPEDRALIQENLQNYLRPLADTAWWSAGMAQLAEFIRMGDDPDALIRAHRTAAEGARAYPDSVGERLSLAIQKAIEAPDYALEGMSNDNPGRESLLIRHKNLDSVHFRAYRIDLLKTIETARDYNLLPAGRELEQFIAANRPVHEWQSPLPSTPDFRMHKTFVIPPMTEPGTYLVVASARSGFPQEDNRLQGLHMIIGDLVLVTRQLERATEITVLSGSSGKPVDAAEVMLYRMDWQTGHQKIDAKFSDLHGRVSFNAGRNNFQGVIVARKEKHITYDRQFVSDAVSQPPESRTATIFYTDRSIYRPGQKLLWKAVLYKGGSDGIRFETSPTNTFTVSLIDGNGQTVESKTVTTNRFGTASGEFFIPTGRILGRWRLESSQSGQTTVRIEEYKRPTFEVSISDPEQPLRLNQKARITGKVKYYFGLPVTSGRVAWQVMREPVFPRWWHLIEGYYRFNFSPSQAIASGIADLKQDGAFSIEFLPEIDERQDKNKDITYRYSVSADITDEGGETRSARRTFRLGFVSIEAEARPEKNFFYEDDPVTISVRRATLDGIGKEGRGSWRIVALKGPETTLLPAEQPLFIPREFREKAGYQTPGDLKRERWDHGYNPETVLMQWQEGPQRAAGVITHDKKGMGNISASPLPPGAYRLIYETMDDFGTAYELKQNFIVAGPALPLQLPAILALERSSAGVGETMRILAHSGLADQLVAVEVFRDGKPILQKVIHTDRDASLLEIPVTEEHRGGLTLSMTLLRDNQFIRLSESLMVPWDNKKLKVEFSTFRDRLRPGQQETWRVRVTGPSDQDTSVAAAELLAYMYDRSLDYFAPHSPFDILRLYPSRAGMIGVSVNLGAANQVWLNSQWFPPGLDIPGLYKDALRFYSGYGIGGPGRRMKVMARAAEEMALETSESAMPEGIGVGIAGGVVGGVVGGKLGARVRGDSVTPMGSITDNLKDDGRPTAIELRSDFSETAFWQPHLLTDADGAAVIEFTVPDSVTSWNVWVHALTRDLKSGFIQREAQSIKELMVRPYLPRFLREGDRAEIPVVINNASDRELSGHLDFDIIDVAGDRSLLAEFGLSAAEVTGRQFAVPAGGGTTLTFPVTTPKQPGEVAFRVTARSGEFSDGELRPIPILPGRFHLMQSRFITMKAPGRRVMRFEDLARDDDPTRIHQQMVVTLDAQLFYSVLSAIPYLVNYPYESTEQILNRFLSTGILASLYREYPAIERMAKEFSARETRLERWDEPDPNRRMALEETPWLQQSRGGRDDVSDLINVLDSRIAAAERAAALEKLREAQTAAGGFPWFAGGPPSPYMTLYLLHGFSRALEFGVDVPGDMVERAWGYMHRHYLDDIVREMTEKDSGWQFVTFINYVLSNFPDASWYQSAFTPDERRAMLDFSFRHWQKHSPFLKGYLALTLQRMGRPEQAALVWESVMDSARTVEDQGTFWAPEDRAWLWYNDTIETHAFALRA